MSWTSTSTPNPRWPQKLAAERRESPAPLTQFLRVAKHTGIAHTICTRPETVIFHIGRCCPGNFLMRLQTLIVAVALSACRDSDLPAGWSSAKSVELNQGECVSPAADSNESVSAETSEESVAISASLRMRCQQQACAFVQQTDATLMILLQPCEMHPDAVAKCDCTYDVSFELDLDNTVSDVELYTRGDAYAGDPGPPRLIHAESVAR